MKVNTNLFKEIKLNKVWVIRGVRVKDSGIKEVIAEDYHDEKPTETDIAKFLLMNKKCTFVSVVENYLLSNNDNSQVISGKIV